MKWRGFFRSMMAVFPQVRADDEEGHAPEKDSPVGGIQAAGGTNSKGNHSLNHGLAPKGLHRALFP
jgi:hypothetical protein